MGGCPSTACLTWLVEEQLPSLSPCAVGVLLCVTLQLCQHGLRPSGCCSKWLGKTFDSLMRFGFCHVCVSEGLCDAMWVQRDLLLEGLFPRGVPASAGCRLWLLCLSLCHVLAPKGPWFELVCSRCWITRVSGASVCSFLDGFTSRQT